MRKRLSLVLALILLTGALLSVYTTPAQAAGIDKAALNSAVNKTAGYILGTVKNPQVDSVGGEWAVIGLARSGYDIPDSYFEGYYRTVERYVREHGAILHDRKYTDNSRVILGLTAAGYDPRNVAGHDLTAALGDFDKTAWQGINGPIFALLALDSMNYPIPINLEAETQATRDMYIGEMLRRQLDDGGWNLTGGASDDTRGQSADPDLTGMALQALAKYQDKPEVRAATDKAVLCMSLMQDNQGGYTSSFSGNSSAVESAVQVLVALCELGIPADDQRFVKNGKTLIDCIMSYANPDGSFRHANDVLHTHDGSGKDQMATEQALYGLVAAGRALEGRNSLYRMGDAVQRGEFLPIGQETPSGAGLQGMQGMPGKDPDVSAMPVTIPGRTFPDVQNHANRAAIEALAERGIINGKNGTSDDGTPAFVFDPDATMTRAEFAAIVTRGLGLPEKTFLPFNDVPATEWYATAIATAYFYEIVTGIDAETFKPGGTITRQEAAVMVARAAKLCGMDTGMGEVAIRDTLAPFGDYRTVAPWAAAAMALCYDAGILDDTEFDIGPGVAIRRCEIAEMLYRMLAKAELL
ncbi:MAG: S-layer homology domain-containing protein [Oscillospiraceae bacterium]|nr:S-layer homology domain-containing protein [Oscillospiraceae bacterium]